MSNGLPTRILRMVRRLMDASWKACATAALALAICGGTNSWADTETQVFQDGFDAPGLFIENFKPSNTKDWEVRDGVLVGRGGAAVNTPVDADCRVTADVALLKDVDKGGFAGFNLGGINFVLRPDGLWNPYRVKGEDRSKGNLVRRDIKYGQPYRLSVTRKSIGDGYSYSWSVDGQVVMEFSEMSQLEGDASKLSLVAHRIQTQFDNVAIYRLSAGASSRNMVINSSFEYVQDSLPCYWKPAGAILDNYPTHEVFLQVFRVDPSNAHSGKQSLRIETNAQVSKNGFSAHNTPVAKGSPFTYSIWLKADRANVPAQMTAWETHGKNHIKKITIGDSWQKFSFTVDNPEKTTARAGVTISTPAVVWADDAQLEMGKATGDYEPAVGDVQFTRDDDSKLEPVKSLAIPFGTPTLDGAIDKDWANAVVLDDFRLADKDMKPAKERSIARVLADKDNLYIGVSCFTQAKALKAISGDSLGLFGGDCVELFFDTAGAKKDAYHFGVNPDGGKKAIGLKGNLNWQTDWEARTSKHADRWEVEIRIPFKSLEIASAKWGMNLARHNPHTQEDSCTARVAMSNFNKQDRFDEFSFPPGVAMGVAAPAAVASRATEPAVYTERNFYMAEPEAVVVATVPSGGDVAVSLKASDGKTVWSQTAKAKAGKNRITIPLGNVGEGNYVVEVNGAGNARLSKRPPLANAVQIDQARRCLLVDGKPYLPVAPLLSAESRNPSRETQVQATLKYMADAGFKTVMLGMHAKGADLAFTRRTLDHCQQVGLKAIVWMFIPGADFVNKDVYTPMVEKLKDHPALIAWLAVDEPELYSKPEDVIAIMNEVRRLDPYRPVFMNNTKMGIPSHYAGLPTDLLSIDDYLTNREGRTVADVLESIATMCAVSRETLKPAFAFHSGENLHNHYREPTAGEQVAQTYGGMIKGMSGCWYFGGIPFTQQHWEAYKRTNAELVSLTDVLFSAEESPAIASGDGSVLAMARRHNGKLYLITVNIENRALNASFRLPAEAKSAQVLFENRRVELKDGALQDNYEPHQRHVYMLE